MLDAKDRQALALARQAKDDAEPTWWDARWAFIFIAGGILFFVWDLVGHSRPGAPGGFLLGGGLLSLLIQVPLARHLWRCYRVIRHADEQGAFEEPPAT